MSDIVLVNVPFNRKQKLEPEEQRYFDVYEEVTYSGFDDDVKRSYSAYRDRLDEYFGSSSLRVYDVPEIPIWVTGLSGVLGAGGIDHELLDMNADKMGESQLPYKLKKTCGRVFLLSSFTNNADNAAYAASVIKQTMGGDAVVIYGGHHATFRAEETLENPDFDIVVRNEGEGTLPEVLDYVMSGKSLDGIAGITYRHDKTIISNPNRPLIRDLGTLPPQNVGILPNIYKLNFYGRVFTSRGCPNNCSFCAETMWNHRKPRFFPLDRALEDVDQALTEMDVKYLFINDENFVMNRDFSAELARKLAGYDIPWSCQTRVDLVDEGLFKTMRESNCRGIFFGAESGSQRVLDRNNKRITLAQTRKACEIAKRSGLQVNTNWLVGLAGETHESAMQTIEMAEDLLARRLTDRVEYYIAVPYPGSPLNERPDEFGITLRDIPYSEYREDRPSVISTEELGYMDIFHIWKEGLERLAVGMERNL